MTRTCYDALDRPIAVIDGQLRATVTDYNAAHQPVAIKRWRVASPSSCTISVAGDAPSETRWRRLAYTSGGMLLSETDARGNVTTLDYDGLGRLYRTIYPDATDAWTLTDERGQARFRRKRAGDWAVVYYDAAGRDYHVIEFDNGATGVEGRNVRAGLDLAGRPVWRDVSTQGATWNEALRRDVRTYGYDDAGRLTQDHWQPEGPSGGGPTLNLAYGYDHAGNRTSITWPGSWTATYAFDAANRPISATFPGGGGSRTVAMSYDSLSRRYAIDRPGSAADTAYTYEPDSDLASLSHGFVPATGPGAVTFSYGHDASGKVTSIGIDQPAFEWAPTTAYARAYGTPTSLNQTTSENSVAVSWDGNGNMTTDGTNTYTWTYGNRLAGASRTGMTATYAYDSDDRRTKKIHNGVTTRTLWSGADELAETDASGTILRYIVPDGSGAMDARLATVNSAGTVTWLHTDHQGSVIATSNDAGEVVEAVSYSPYGEFGPGQSAPPAGSPFGYTGRQFDAETGLYQYRARYFHTRLGVFLSTDPIGTKDDPNLYMYVGLDPVNHIDPTGMREIYMANSRTRSAFAAMVNSMSSGQYRFNDSGKLERAPGAVNENGSSTYSKVIDALIDSPDQMEVVGAAVIQGPNGNTIDLSSTGGGLTTYSSTNNDVLVVTDGRGYDVTTDKDGQPLYQRPEHILMHEIMSHAAPAMVGIGEPGSIENENQVRRELGLRERERDDFHN